MRNLTGPATCRIHRAWPHRPERDGWNSLYACMQWISPDNDAVAPHRTRLKAQSAHIQRESRPDSSATVETIADQLVVMLTDQQPGLG